MVDESAAQRSTFLTQSARRKQRRKEEENRMIPGEKQKP